jgi:hypothetical protein
VIRRRGRWRRRYLFDHPTIDLDREPNGGHDFTQLDDHEDDADYLYRCNHCHGVVSGWEIDDGVWPGRIGRYCVGLLMKETP